MLDLFAFVKTNFNMPENKIREEAENLLKTLRELPPFPEMSLEEFDRWDTALYKFLDLYTQKNRLPLTLITELARAIRLKGDPYTASQLLYAASTWWLEKDLEVSADLAAFSALYKFVYGAQEGALIDLDDFKFRIYPRFRAMQMYLRGLYNRFHGDFEKAREQLIKANRLWNKSVDGPVISVTYYKRATQINLIDTCLRLAEEEIEEKQRIRWLKEAKSRLTRYIHGNPDEETGWFYWTNLTEFHIIKGDFDEAEKLISTLLQQVKRAPFPFHESIILLFKARLSLERGDQSETLRYLSDSLGSAIRKSAFFSEQSIIEAVIDLIKRITPLRRRNEVLIGTPLLDFIRNLKNFLSEKDEYTAKDHSMAVARYAVLIAEYIMEKYPLRVRDIDLMTLAIAGVLHDVGKLRLPWILLNRVRPLTQEEYFLIREHIPFSAQILDALKFRHAVPVVLEHHEKLDGSGYPLGKRGISLMGNILSASDSFEAAISPSRRYRVPKHPKEALRTFSKRHFYPEVIEALNWIVENPHAQIRNIKIRKLLDYLA